MFERSPVAASIALIVILISAGSASVRAATEVIEPPTSSTDSDKISLFASEPDIVTPIGATVDHRGRLLVIESQSHFRPKNYQGPPTDRIRLLEDTTGNGKADRIRTFYEGTNFLMNLVACPDGSIVVSSRNEIFRLTEEGSSGIAGKKSTIAKLQTKSDYPHNGLHGLAVDRDGSIYFAIGENLGGPWTLVGADGQNLSGATGAGTIFRVDSQGNGLTRVAHGFWNTFGLGFGPAGGLWAVDNDPDGRPPSRLIQIVPGGDYGFEYRYGRTGMHPLQAWDGELPGTLGMVIGVGEAPCAVVWHQNQFLVSSWRDHQVEAYTLTPRGASFTAQMRPLLKGGDSFRPVGLAFAPDGSLFVADWGSGSYPINGKGRVWKIAFATPASPAAEWKPTEAFDRAAHLRQSDEIAELISGLDDADPHIAQAAQYGLSRLPPAEKIEWGSLSTPSQRIGLLAALLSRGTDLRSYAQAALRDPDDRVRQMAVRVITERGIRESRQALSDLLGSQAMSPRLLGMTVAAINLLDGDPAARIESSKINGVLLSRINSPQSSAQAKAVALHMLQASHPRIGLNDLKPLLQSSWQPLQIEALRYLSDDNDSARFPLLALAAADEKQSGGIRAEAIAGLADDAAAQADLLIKLAGSDNASVRAEALRSLRPAAPNLTKPQQEQVARTALKFPADADLVHRVLGRPVPERPAEIDIPAWQNIVDAAPGNPEAGRRIFFQHAGAGCYHCHMIEGRGRAVGPDLTMIGHSQTREHVLESILEPSKEIAPLYTLWSITTKSGQRIDGMLLRRDGQGLEVYVDATAQEIKVPEPTITDRKMRKESLMPTGLAQGMTDQELRDLMALLMQKR